MVLSVFSPAVRQMRERMREYTKYSFVLSKLISVSVQYDLRPENERHDIRQKNTAADLMPAAVIF